MSVISLLLGQGVKGCTPCPLTLKVNTRAINTHLPQLFSMPYIYLIHCRASMNAQEPVYKIGKSNDFLRRLSAYDKGSTPMLSIYVTNCDTLETHLLGIFNSLYKPRRDYGREYFEGNMTDMIRTIVAEHTQFQQTPPLDCPIMTNSADTQLASLATKKKLTQFLNRVNIDNIHDKWEIFQQLPRDVIDYSFINRINEYRYNSNDKISVERCLSKWKKDKLIPLKLGDYMNTHHYLDEISMLPDGSCKLNIIIKTLKLL